MCEEEALLRKLLTERPKNARAMAQLACLLAERAASDDTSLATKQEALALAAKAIAVAPHKPFGYAALSMIHPSFDQRMRALRSAIQHSNNTTTHVIAKIGLLERSLLEPRLEAARQASQRGVARASRQHPSRQDLNRSETAIYDTVEVQLRQRWDTKDSMSGKEIEYVALRDYNLGLFFRKRHPPCVHQPRAVHHFRRAHQHFPDDHANRVMCQFWLETLLSASSSSLSPSGGSAMTRCPAEYVVGLYSTFAGRFDDLLVEQLEYRTPTVLRQLLDEAFPSCKKWNRAMDLGCGTGLSGLAFRDCVCGDLVGVDLSQEMIAKAESRGCYEELLVGDVVSALGEKHQQHFDLVIACDVFVYLGDLSEVFSNVYQSLNPNGVFVFSTELLSATENTEAVSYRLQACARFAHSNNYIEWLSTRVGFTIRKTLQAPIRKNKGKDVGGLLVILLKAVT